MRRGLVEWAVVTALLVLGTAGAAWVWGDRVRSAFGVRPPAAAVARTPGAR